MNLKEFKKKAEADLGMGMMWILRYKTKAAHEMIAWVDEKGNQISTDCIIGPEAGHSVNYKYWGITFEGWAYKLIGEEWFLVKDGSFGWRETKTNPFPEFSELPIEMNALVQV